MIVIYHSKMSYSTKQKTPETINIHLQNNDNVSQDENRNNDTTSYIIDLNQRLLLKNQELEKKIERMKNDIKNKEEELEEKDDEIGLTEKSNGNYKSILKNFVEETKNFKEISNIYKEISDNNYSHITEFRSNMKDIRYSVLCYYAFISMIFMGVYDFYILCIVIMYSFSAIGVVEYYIWNFTFPDHTRNLSKIKEKKKEIKKIDEGLGYIYKFIEDAI